MKMPPYRLAISNRLLAVLLALIVALLVAPVCGPDGAGPSRARPQKGDIAWMTSTLLVILMTMPGLALFYGGLVRSKNMLSVLMQVMVVFSLIIVLWSIYGYSAGPRRRRLLR